MTNLKICAAALLCAALLSSPARADATETAKAAGKDASWLFIQTAQKVQFDGTTLTLSGVNPSVVMFTDRPARTAEAIPTATFVKDWGIKGKDSFVADPPNAGLTSIVDGKLQIATVELKQPYLDGTTLTFQARIIEGAVPASGGTTSVFIDGGQCGPLDPRC
ncbi:hypothetical protein AB4Z01_05555 [Inquilinus sp. YAF38]|uniref:hypothetical protein n=1 Tax=Inquilinus sp. YAF38 TaxID=3233084 RepID=UPI003F9016D6